jgi:hypothetical protein
MRYLLWNGDVNIPLRDRDSKYMVLIRGSWQNSLMVMQQRMREHAPVLISQLEVHCHGLPGEVRLTPTVDSDSVECFGDRLRPLMQPNGMIELLCCLVASIRIRMTMDDLKRLPPMKHSLSVQQNYFGAFQKNPVRLALQGFVTSELRQDPTKAVVPINGEVLDRYQSIIALYASRQLPKEGNGLWFCQALARTSGCRVRAASLVQWEEHSNLDVEITRSFDTFGRFEGLTFDFHPDGNVEFLGLNYPRYQIHFPEHQVGPVRT